MTRFTTVALLGVLALAMTSGSASAQFNRYRYLGPSPAYVYPNGNGGYGVGIPFNFSANSVYGRISFPYIYPYNSGGGYSGGSPYLADYYPGSVGGYMTGGSSSGYDSYASTPDIVAAQQAAARAVRKNQDEARDLIDAQWAYEKLGVTGQIAAKSAKIQPEELQKALAVKDESEVASGDALNRVLVAIVVAEGKGAKGMGGFIPPQLLEDLRFSGGPNADLLNLVRLSDTIPFPANFPGPTLQELKLNLETDFAAAIAPLRNGKSVDPAKVAKLEASLHKLDAASPPLIRNLSFDDAIAARRFLNQFDSAILALKKQDIAGVINPKWATDGTSVSDLVKFMTKYKLMFAPAPAGTEGSYFAVHKTLATYLLILTQVKK